MPRAEKCFVRSSVEIFAEPHATVERTGHLCNYSVLHVGAETVSVSQKFGRRTLQCNQDEASSFSKWKMRALDAKP